MKKTVKIVVSGDGGVGKTSFLNRLVYDFFNESNELTKGVDFYSKIIQVNGTEFNFVLWDLAGQSQFKEILDDFVEGSIAAFVLFDLSRISTIDSVYKWINKLGEWGNIPIIILGTKYDLVDLKTCTLLDEYISNLLSSNQNIIEYLKISSKKGLNINLAFNLLLMKLSQ
ncbi:MAG: Rab family GTPase [Candidatus Heimdallarchaeota archaeon]